MHEHPSNIGRICPKCAEERGPGKFKDKPPSWFVGKHVKLAFPIKDYPLPVKLPSTPEFERMWLYVLEAKEKSCVGVLNNDPVYCRLVSGVDIFEFSPEEVLEVWVVHVTRIDGRSEPDEPRKNR
jgi:hypothetical protein